MVTPTYYREHKFGDHYNGINFGVIDVDVTPGATGDKYSLIVRILNHRREVVIEKVIPLRPRDTRQPRVNSDQLHLAPLNGWTNEHRQRVCSAIHGDLPYWRLLLARAAILFVPFIAVVVPLFVLLWFVITSVLYLVYGAEERRRERLLKKYHEKSKKS